jgi:hypothetical protein
VLLDEFDHFGQTFGDINVSIDSSYEGCTGTSTPNQHFLLKLANSFEFHHHRAQNRFAGNSPRTIHREKIKIPLDFFKVVLDDCSISDV